MEDMRKQHLLVNFNSNIEHSELNNSRKCKVESGKLDLKSVKSDKLDKSLSVREAHVKNLLPSKKAAFSLAEMMVVLLIMSIAMAAMAPIVTTKMKHDKVAAGADVVWHWDTDRQNGWFGKNAVNRAMVGQESPQKNASNVDIDLAKLIINNTNPNYSHILFKNDDAILGSLRINGNAVGFGTGTLNTNGISIGIGSDAKGEDDITIGHNAGSNANDSGTSGNIAIGSNALNLNEDGKGNVAIGLNANTYSSGTRPSLNNTVAIGNGAKTESDAAIAIGLNAGSTGSEAIAIGKGTTASSNYSVVVGSNSSSGGLGAISIGSGYTDSGTTYNGSSAGGVKSIAIGTASGASSDNAIAVGNSASATAANTIAIGRGAIASGTNTESLKLSGIAIGSNVAGTTGPTAGDAGGIAIGSGYVDENNNNGASATGRLSIAIGSVANASGARTVAIGARACQYATGSDVTCIGAGSGPASGGARAGDSHIVWLGTKDDIVYIPGSLVVGKDTVLGASAPENTTGEKGKFNEGPFIKYQNAANGPDGSTYFNSLSNQSSATYGVYIKPSGYAGGYVYDYPSGNWSYVSGGFNSGKTGWGLITNSAAYGLVLHVTGTESSNTGTTINPQLHHGSEYIQMSHNGTFETAVSTTRSGLSTRYPGYWYPSPSDRRLKYIGQEFKSGLDKIKQLKVFNYTFKRDPQKTPHVGVIAQDLQKIFPDAVTKDPDGFLMIRMEDMFYALINAVKELDAKVSQILSSIQNDRKTLKQVQDDNKRLQKTLNQVQSDNKELKARLERLEAKMK